MLAPAEYQRVFKHGRKQRGEFFTLISCANGNSHARLGLAIAKKYVPLAVERNRVRRIIRETFRQHEIVLKGIDIIVLAQTHSREWSNTRLHEVLNRQWQRLISAHTSC